MDCPLCGSFFDGWRSLHRHLVDDHGDAIELTEPRDGGAPLFQVACPSCSWTFGQELRGRRDPAFAEAHKEEISLVAFDQLMVHWVEEHLEAAEEVSTGGQDGNGERM